MKEICGSANRSPKSEDPGFLCYALFQFQKALERKNVKRVRVEMAQGMK